ncbi:mitogen-activated protein kinase kinase kinase 5 isoform X2 [Nicotiana tabacum]|uniref:mitogen-activated protein kinase kinase kinase n=1 Tax=Nicotiana tabacum TaxID=4097 RepID=A0A1S3XMR8_TOBAC|nr:PREDICTED: mitogen-activated protein kinase kinase kinase YODA-like isoform X2 [Nicotiana tabacum]
MRWWQNAFSSSTSSSSASSSSSLSSKVHSDDSLIASSGGGGSIRYPLKSAFFFARRRRHARAKKLQNLAENDVDDWRSHYSENENLSSSKCSSSSDRRPPPQPLPLPELQLLLRHDADAAVSNEPSVPLPSPTDAHNSHHKTGEERDEDTHKDGVASHGRLSSQDARKKKKEHLGSRLSRKTPQKLHVTDRVSDIRISAPISAPTTPYASPGLSPLKAEDFLNPNCMAFPGAFQVCSAPEMPPSDTPHYPGFSYKVIPEKNAFSVDNSPHHSPRASPQRSRKIASGSTSPLHNLLPNESSARRESSAQGNVHPLPLPPLSVTPSQQPTAIPPVSPNAELTPIKGQWQKGKLIGRGTFGSVYVASNRETGALCAMKEVELLPDDPKSAESIRQLQQEINVLSQLKHPNIVQYYGSEIVGDRFYIYLEYVHPGSINKFIHDHCGAITESIVRNFTRHILCGLAYLHSKKTIHRDIKGANLLVDAYGVVKLADFGMAKHLNGQAANLSLKGSPYWMAPELLQSVMQKDTNSDLAFATDIWSLGCTVIEMLNGKPPWSEYEAAAAMFKVLKDTPPIPETLSPEGKDFLRWCFCRNPAERPSASMLLEHRFMRISHQPDVPSFLKPAGGVRIKEKLNSQKEQTTYNLDQGRLSLER